MAREERFYAFIIAHTSRSRARVQRIRIEKRVITIFSAICLMVALGIVFGFYGLTQQAAHLRTQMENERLKAENDRQKQQLEKLNNRVEKVEDTSRKLAEKSGMTAGTAAFPGSGGPELPLDELGFAALQSKMNRLEHDISAYDAVMRKRGYTPSIWPVEGTLESGFGGRRNPFGGSGYEFHSGQDIEAAQGTPVIAGARGIVAFAGWQNGYGQLVVVDHGGGLSTRYGHLSHIDVAVGQDLARGQFLGRVGSTGRSTGPHLHYEVRIDNEPVNPLQYLLSGTSSAN